MDDALTRAGLRIAAVIAAAGLVGLLAWATLAASQGKSLVARVAAGEKPAAPAFELEAIWPETDRRPPDLASSLRDGELSLDELRGRSVVLNFWASWCIPCREEAPILAASSRAHAGKVRFVGIDVQDLRGDALAFLREFDVPYASLRDRDDETYRAYGLTGVPETYYVDAGARIAAHTPGPVTAETLERGIAETTRGARG